MTLKIQGLAWDRHKFVAGLNQLCMLDPYTIKAVLDVQQISVKVITQEGFSSIMMDHLQFSETVLVLWIFFNYHMRKANY